MCPVSCWVQLPVALSHSQRVVTTAAHNMSIGQLHHTLHRLCTPCKALHLACVRPVRRWAVQITWSILVDPVTTPSGISYERRALLEHLERGNKCVAAVGTQSIDI